LEGEYAVIVMLHFHFSILSLKVLESYNCLTIYREIWFKNNLMTGVIDHFSIA